MKILQINSVFSVGSTGRIVYDISESLIAAGHESLVAYGREPNSTSEFAHRIGNNYSVYKHVLLTRLLDMHGFGSKKATNHFLHWIDKQNPDVIHLHNIHGYYINVFKLFDYLRVKRIPVVWTLHDCWAFTGHCSYFDYVGCSKWMTKCEKCPQVHMYPSSFGVDNSSMNYLSKRDIFAGIENLTIVTPSVWLSSLVKKSFLRDYEVQILNNGIDLSIFQKRDSDFRARHGLGNKFIILGVANVWEERKGLRVLRELAGLLRDDEQLVIVGANENEMEGGKRPHNVTLVKRTRNATELAQVYSTADVFVNPTFEDNYPTTNLESLACGTPVIAFDTGGNSEVIDSECLGIIVRNKTAIGLRNAVDTMRTSGDLQHAFQPNAALLHKLDKFRLASDYVALYQTILEA